MCANVQAWSQSFSYTDPFLFMAGGVLNPGTEPGAVEEVITREIASLRDNGPSPEELARACKQARASFIYDMDSIVDEAQNIIGFELLGSCERIHEYLPGIEAVTAADVSRVAADYLREVNSTTGVFAVKNGEYGGEVPDGAV
jgi:zinc protease